MTWTYELDQAAVLATRKGYWHILLFYLLCGLAGIPTSFLVFSQVFTNATPEHWCAPSQKLEDLALPHELLRNLTIPKHHGVYENCRSYDIDVQTLYAALGSYIINRSKINQDGGYFRKVKVKEGIVENEQIARIQDIISKTIKDTVPCQNGWKFNTEHYHRTLVTEFFLVCDKEWLPRTSNTLFWLIYRYGRRPTILIMIALEVPISIAASFPGNYWSYIALRIAGGLFFPALYQLPFILALELMPPERRAYTGIVVGMLFGGGMCLLALVAYLCRDWFYLSLATSVPFVVLFGYYWLIPESPRWLVGRGRVADAENVLRNLAMKNGIRLERGFLLELHKKAKEEEEEISILNNLSSQQESYECRDRKINNLLSYNPIIISDVENTNLNKVQTKVTETDNFYLVRKTEGNEESTLNNITNEPTKTEHSSKIIKNIIRRKSIQFVNRILVKDQEEDMLEKKRVDDQNSEGDCKASPLDIFRYPNIRKKFFLLTINWIAIGVVYNSLSYNTSNLGVDDYLAFFIGGAVELPSYFIAWKCMDRYGRRWVLCAFISTGGFACLSCALVPEAWPWITVFLAMLGRLCAAASFAVFYVHIGELLPTVLRAQAMASASFISGIGLLSCPYIVSLAAHSRALPLIVMGALSLVAGIVVLFLPETLNEPLPQTLGDGEIFGRDLKMFSCVQVQRK